MEKTSTSPNRVPMKWWACSLWVGAICVLFGQEEITALEKKLSDLKGSARVSALGKLTRHFYITDPARALRHGEEALSLLASFPDPGLEILLYNDMGWAHMNQGRFREGMAFAEKARAIAEARGDQEGLSQSLNSIAVGHVQLGELDQALEYHRKALEIRELLGKPSLIAGSRNNLGLVYFHQGNYNQALDHFLKAYEIFDQLGDPEKLQYTQNNLGLIYHQLRDFENALKYHSMALDVREKLGRRQDVAHSLNNMGLVYDHDQNYVTALDFYQRALSIYRELGDEAFMAHALNNLGALQQKMNRLEPAWENLSRALQIREETGDKFRTSETLLNLANLQLTRGEHEEALVLAERALSLAADIKAKDLQRNGYHIKSNILAATGTFEGALEAFKQFKAVTDEMFNEETSSKLTQLQSRFEAQQREKEIMLLKKENEIKTMALGRQKVVRNFWIAGLVLVFLMFLLGISRRAQARALVKERAISEHLREVDKLKDEFLAKTSHELKNPLVSMIGLAESLLEGSDRRLVPQIKNQLAMIVFSGKRLTSLVNDILIYSKLKYKKLELDKAPIGLHPLVEIIFTLLRPQAESRHLACHNEVPEDFPLVEADENRLQQIVFNLVSNAIKFTGEGAIRVSASLREKHAVISVTDTGIGIREEDRNRIFNTFEQGSVAHTETRGVGLGLSVTQQLVALHGGEIWVASRLGQGSTFSFTLPLYAGPVPERPHSALAVPLPDMAAIAASEPEDDGDAPSFQIMVVDDDSVQRVILRNYLSLQNYRVLEADNGADALAMVARQPCDLVLLDVMMPGMSGFEVCNALRQKFSFYELPVIFMTANTQIPNLTTGFQLGANDFLYKPVSREELLARVKTHLKLMETHRGLEEEVRNRTRQLELKSKVLEQINGMVNAINKQMTSTDLLQALLRELRVLPGVVGVRALVRERDGDRVLSTVLNGEPEYVTQPFSVVEHELLSGAEPQGEGLFLRRSPWEEGATPNQLVTLIGSGDETQGLIVLDLDPVGSSGEVIPLVDNLKEHFVSSFQKTRLLAQLNDALASLAQKHQKLKETQSHLIHAEKIAGMGRLLAGVVHEISNPTNFIHVGSQNLEEDLRAFLSLMKDVAGEEGDEAWSALLEEKFAGLFRHTATIQNGTSRIKGIISNLRHFSRMEPSGRVRGRVVQGLETTVNLARPNYKNSVNFVCRFEADPEVACWPEELNQVFLNLVVNACQAIEAKFGSSGENKGELVITTRTTEQHLAIDFEDNGVGMSEAVRKKIFEPFFTTKPTGQGTGLGLSISYDIVGKHNGHIDVVAEESIGATFTVFIPLLEKGA